MNHSNVQNGEREMDAHSKEVDEMPNSCRSNNCERADSHEEPTRCKVQSRGENVTFSDVSRSDTCESSIISQGSTLCQFSKEETHVSEYLKKNSHEDKNTSPDESLTQVPYKKKNHKSLSPVDSDTGRNERIWVQKFASYNQEMGDTLQAPKNVTDESNNKPTFTCDKCKKTYLSKTALAKHTKYHSAETKISCKKCSETFDAQDKLVEHLKKHKVSEFKCEVCSKKFTDQAKLNSHLRVHGKGPPIKMDKQFLCDVCSKTFASRTGLGFHLRTHTGYKPYTCQYCSKGFTISSNKIRHERTHTGDKHFICHFCNIAFASSNGLKYHLTIHTGETNYHCKTCGKSFTRLKYLKEHNFTHTGEKPFKCKICSASYGNSGSLFAHEKKCKAQYSTCLAETNECSGRESQFIPNQGSNGILYSKIHGQPQHELQFPYNQEMPPISYLLPPQNPSPPEVQYQTTHHLVSTIRPVAVSSGTWQCFTWSDAT